MLVKSGLLFPLKVKYKKKVKLKKELLSKKFAILLIFSRQGA